MRIYVDRQTHMPFYLPIECPVGFCEPGVSAGEDCCGCYRRPPPPCGPCFGEQDVVMEDLFDHLEPGWFPDFECEPDYEPLVCRWDADGLLYVDSYLGPITGSYHNYVYPITPALYYWNVHLRQVSLNGSTWGGGFIAQSYFGIADVTIYYHTGHTAGLNTNILELWHQNNRVFSHTEFEDQLPMEYSVSIVDDGYFGEFCFAVDGEILVKVARTGPPSPATYMAFGASGGYRDVNGHNLRMAEWDYICLRDMEFAEPFSAKTKQWLASVNA